MTRARFAPAYLVGVLVCAPTALALVWWLTPPVSASWPVLLVLLALGAASARLRDAEGDFEVDLSFTAAILLAAVPVGGPAGAGALGAVVPFLGPRRGGLLATVFNSAMTSLLGTTSGLTYLALGGWVPVPHHAEGLALLQRVAWPLVGADVVLCLVNLALVAGMIWLHQAPGERVAIEPFVATLPVYLGYAVTAFLFVVLWGPGGLGVVAAALMVAPLLVARWAYVQYAAQSWSRARILEALAAAAETRDWSALRSRRLDALLKAFEAELGLPRRVGVALRYGAALHDIGMVAIPRETLDVSAERIDADGLALVRSHVLTGYEAIRDIGFLEEAAQAVRHHHERWDGTGYPDGLAGRAIPLPARILAIVDAYEALAWADAEASADRAGADELAADRAGADEAVVVGDDPHPRGDAPTPARAAAALAEIGRRSGRDFDPRLTAVFLATMTSAAQPDPSAAAPAETTPMDPAQRRAAARRPPLRHADPALGDRIAAADRRALHARTAATQAASATALAQEVGATVGARVGATVGPDERSEAGAGVRSDAGTDAGTHAGPDAGTDQAPAAAPGSARPGPPRRHLGRARRGGESEPQVPPAGARRLVGTLFVALTTLLVVVLALSGDRPRAESADLTVAAVYLLTLVVAERFRMRLQWRLETAPTAAAAGLALALTLGLPGIAHLDLHLVEVVGIVVAAQTLDLLVRYRRRSPVQRREALLDAAIRAGSVLLVALVMRLPLPWGSLAQTLTTWPGWLQALTMMIVVLTVLALEAVARAWPRAREERSTLGRETLEEIRGSGGLASAVAATAVLVALAEQVLGLVAVPLLLMPLAVSQLAFRRFVDTLSVYRQSVRALSRLPELAGFVPAGHAGRVADLAVTIAVRMGLPEPAVRDTEYAAMLHDLGQLSLRRPLPQGATVLASAADQARIAARGARIVEQTGTLAQVAEIVRRQAVPYHRVMGRRERQPLASRIVKVANAYEDYRGADPVGDPAQAVERLYLGLGHEFDPKVVRACEVGVLGEGSGAEPGPATGRTTGWATGRVTGWATGRARRGRRPGAAVSPAARERGLGGRRA